MITSDKFYCSMLYVMYCIHIALEAFYLKRKKNFTLRKKYEIRNIT